MTTISRTQLEFGLAPAQSPLRQSTLPPEGPSAALLFPTPGADGITVDRCTGDVYISDRAAGVVRRFDPETEEIQIEFSDLQEPGSLLALYRSRVSCPHSFRILLVEDGFDRLTLLVPSTQLVVPLVAALESTDLAFLPGGTPFAATPSLLVTELLEGQAAQQNGLGYSLGALELSELYRDQPDNPELGPGEEEVVPPELVSPEDGEVISQNDSTIGCKPHPTRGFGYRILFDWTDSFSASGTAGYDLFVRNRKSEGPIIDTFVKQSDFEFIRCNAVEEGGEAEWGVRCKDNQGRFSPWQIGEFRFADCRLQDGTPCRREIDLALSKRDSADPVAAGDLLTYILTVKNGGPSTANKVTLVDELPPDVIYVASKTTHGICKETQGGVECGLGVLGKGDITTVAISVIVGKQPKFKTLVNVARVEAVEDDLNEFNNTAVEETEIEEDAVPEADLAIAKSDSPDPVVQGARLTYTLTVKNGGPSTANKVTVFDTLPGDVAFLSAKSSQGSCREFRGLVECSLGVLERGAGAEIIINVVVRTSSRDALLNEARVQGAEKDPDGSNNTDKEETAVEKDVVPEIDLAVFKSGSPDPVASGQELVYELTVKNAGPGTATEVVLLDALPPEVTFVTAKSSQGSCSQSGSLVTCALGELTRGSGAEAVIVVVVNKGIKVETLINTAKVDAAEKDLNEFNNAAVEETTVEEVSIPEIDLALAKTDFPDPVAPEGDLTYNLTVTNAGPDTATNVRLTDKLPVQVSLTALKTSQGECSASGGAVTCELGELERGASAEVVIAVLVNKELQTDILLNNAVVTATEKDFDNFNNSAQARTEILKESTPRVDLALSKSDSSDPVNPGGTLIYSLKVVNLGPGSASQVTVIDKLPAGVTVQAAKSTQGLCSVLRGVVTCGLGVLKEGGSAEVLISVLVEKGAEGTVLMNSASVSSDEADSDVANNADEETTQVEKPQESLIDLSLSKSDSSDPVAPGDPLTYGLTVKNAGPEAATQVSVVDTLPSEVSFVSAKSSQGSCSGSESSVICELGSLEAGAEAEVLIDVLVIKNIQVEVITNAASVQAAESDSDTTNNSDQEITQVDVSESPEIDLSVTKSDFPDPVAPGDGLAYKLAVSNLGPDTATKVRLTDRLPPEVLFQSADGNCFHSNGLVTCDLGTIPSGASQEVTILVEVNKGTKAGTITNLAVVDAAETDSDQTNNTDQATTKVEIIPPPPPEADLSLSKSGSPATVSPGDKLSYRLTVNNLGPDTASDVRLTDNLPSEVTLGSPPKGCTEKGGRVTCDLGILGSKDSASITITVTVPRETQAKSITNSAGVSADEQDPDSSNNTAKATTTIAPQ